VVAVVCLSAPLGPRGCLAVDKRLPNSRMPFAKVGVDVPREEHARCLGIMLVQPSIADCGLSQARACCRDLLFMHFPVPPRVNKLPLLLLCVVELEPALADGGLELGFEAPSCFLNLCLINSKAFSTRLASEAFFSWT